MSLKLDLCLDLSAAILLLGFEPPAQAHDIYSPLKDRWGNSCCHDQDCRPAHYRMTPAGVQMLINGEWIAVPDHAIQYRALPGDTGETDGGHWCGNIFFKHSGGVEYSTHCAILPPNPTTIGEGLIQPVP
jgi:hypothetical protein